jgi:hypothetical protein
MTKDLSPSLNPAPQWREDKKKILDSPVKPGNDRMFLFPPFIKEG